MRHKKAGRKLSRTTEHRLSMFRNMVTSLFLYEKIKTTEPKAKELQSIAEKLINKAKDNSLHSRRQVRTYVENEDVIKKLFDEIAPRYKERHGGYTRIFKLGPRRGDSAPTAQIELLS